jgi:hypothetical protein
MVCGCGWGKRKVADDDGIFGDGDEGSSQQWTTWRWAGVSKMQYGSNDNELWFLSCHAWHHPPPQHHLKIDEPQHSG